MSKGLKIFLYILLGLFLLIQLYPFEKPKVTHNNPNDLIQNYEVPENVATLLKNACYDCHSNESVYPWYSYIAPVKWAVFDHINEGREDLNFSEWKTLNKQDMAEALDDITDEVSEGEMPLKPYPLTHPKAKLSDADKEAISEWAEAFTEKLFD